MGHESLRVPHFKDELQNNFQNPWMFMLMHCFSLWVKTLTNITTLQSSLLLNMCPWMIPLICAWVHHRDVPLVFSSYTQHLNVMQPWHLNRCCFRDERNSPESLQWVKLCELDVNLIKSNTDYRLFWPYLALTLQWFELIRWWCLVIKGRIEMYRYIDFWVIWIIFIHTNYIYKAIFSLCVAFNILLLFSL